MDPDCGVNAIINYTIGDQPGKYLPFEIKAATGELCVSRSLDYEQQSSYEFPIIATDRGKAITTQHTPTRVGGPGEQTKRRREINSSCLSYVPHT